MPLSSRSAFAGSPRIAFFKCKEEKCKRLAVLQQDGTICCCCKRYELDETEHERKWIQNKGIVQEVKCVWVCMCVYGCVVCVCVLTLGATGG